MGSKNPMFCLFSIPAICLSASPPLTHPRLGGRVCLNLNVTNVRTVGAYKATTTAAHKPNQLSEASSRFGRLNPRWP
ncbi:hypothetical protein B0H67DRAFT_568073 [Lasiosphaeris hirsuta]|uniref:Secreted protein n=1 Tax=Lasiosphaeris hirsuta TaxID=260670 RepID=A0AA40AYV7_9PEZI|nr:hypothetical protein B0H67DRAFT_568073 [Lasiosphaeris hirsuta]